jgi:hypothetical protein
MPDNAAELLNSYEGERKKEAEKLVQIMSDSTGHKPELWSGNMVGFGSYHYRYESGREGDWFLTGFAVRKDKLSIYIVSGFDRHQELMNKLGKYKTGKSCLYVKKLDDIDKGVLARLIRDSVDHMKKLYC